MRKGSNDTVGGTRCPRCVGTTRSREIRQDGINITKMCVDQVIFQRNLESSFFGLREMRCDIFSDRRQKGSEKPVHVDIVFEGRGST